jgi:hypothetical protein
MHFNIAKALLKLIVSVSSNLSKFLNTIVYKNVNTY